MSNEGKPRSPLKDPPLRVPGQSLNSEIQSAIDDATLFWILLPLVLWVFAGFEWWGLTRGIARQPEWFALAAVVMSLIGGYRVYRVRAKIKALRLGLAGERFVGQMLDELRVDGARIFHDVLGDAFNVDHIVISTRGVYCVETKTLTKPYADAKIHFDGQRVVVAGYVPDRDPIKQVTAAARWLEARIAESTGRQFPVRPVVVFPRWWVESAPHARLSAVWVLEPKALLKWIGNAQATIADADVAMISYHIGRMIRAGEKKELGIQ
jgi:hypothetical protein